MANSKVILLIAASMNLPGTFQAGEILIVTFLMRTETT